MPMLNGFMLSIPGHHDWEGYADIEHLENFEVVLSNSHSRRCDVTLTISGKVQGIYRIGPNGAIRLERRDNNSDRWVAILPETEAGEQAGLTSGDPLQGLISAKFELEKPVHQQNYGSRGVTRGGAAKGGFEEIGVGEFGHSNQQFVEVGDIVVDPSMTTELHIRLRRPRSAPRIKPLGQQRSTPIPPPIGGF